uniref:Candidate secreted effector n=1 Tax=Meloidogyne incognita TaxID=6306 RepID=A0A914NQE5_MELIC
MYFQFIYFSLAIFVLYFQLPSLMIKAAFPLSKISSTLVSVLNLPPSTGIELNSSI